MAGVGVFPLMCNDFAQTNIHLGFGPPPLPAPVVLAPPPCPAQREQCPLEPNAIPPPHAQGAHNVCNTCRNRIDTDLVPREHWRLDRQFIRRGPRGGPATITNALGVQALLCTFCEADEIAQYKRHMAQGTVAPANTRNGWQNTCTCQMTRLNLSQQPILPGQASSPRYCVRCRQSALNQINIDAAANRNELMNLARDPAGNTATAGIGLLLWRAAHGCPIACRCGRNTVHATATATPKVTHCLCCGGVNIDVAQIRVLRHEYANILAKAATPTGLPALNNVAATFNLAARPPVSRNVAVIVGQPNNNRK